MPAGRPKGIKKSGGRRPGAPNKATKEIKELIRSRDIEKVIDAMFDSALGLYAEADVDTGMEATTKDGEKIKVYQKAPSERASQLLIEQGYGKPTQRVEGGDTPITFKVVVEDVADS